MIKKIKNQINKMNAVNMFSPKEDIVEQNVILCIFLRHYNNALEENSIKEFISQIKENDSKKETKEKSIWLEGIVSKRTYSDMRDTPANAETEFKAKVQSELYKLNLKETISPEPVPEYKESEAYSNLIVGAEKYISLKELSNQIISSEAPDINLIDELDTNEIEQLIKGDVLFRHNSKLVLMSSNNKAVVGGQLASPEIEKQLQHIIDREIMINNSEI